MRNEREPLVRTVITWNVNGLRQRHAADEFLPIFRERPDIVCIQETKTPREKIPHEIRHLSGYHVYCAPAARGSFTEVMLFTRGRPVSVSYGLGDNKCPESDSRVIVADFNSFVLVNIYVPLGMPPVGTMERKLAFLDAFLALAGDLNADGRPVITCGDFSVAHTDTDIDVIKKRTALRIGATGVEREKIDTLIGKGYRDMFRFFHKDDREYTWWPNGFKITERMRGYRLDYFFANERAVPCILGAEIQTTVEGSDHCPVAIQMLRQLP